MIRTVLVVIDPRQRRARGRSSSRFEKMFSSVLLVHVHIVASVELMTLSILKMVGNYISHTCTTFHAKIHPSGLARRASGRVATN